jgi:hypothetical protein
MQLLTCDWGTMLAFKIILYVLTIVGVFFFAFRERRLRQQLTDDALQQQSESASDFDSLYEIRKEMRRDRLLRDLPSRARSELNFSIGLKFLFALAVVIEALIFQK